MVMVWPALGDATTMVPGVGVGGGDELLGRKRGWMLLSSGKTSVGRIALGCIGCGADATVADDDDAGDEDDVAVIVWSGVLSQDGRGVGNSWPRESATMVTQLSRSASKTSGVTLGLTYIEGGQLRSSFKSREAEARLESSR